MARQSSGTQTAISGPTSSIAYSYAYPISRFRHLQQGARQMSSSPFHCRSLRLINPPPRDTLGRAPPKILCRFQRILGGNIFGQHKSPGCLVSLPISQTGTQTRTGRVGAPDPNVRWPQLELSYCARTLPDAKHTITSSLLLLPRGTPGSWPN